MPSDSVPPPCRETPSLAARARAILEEVDRLAARGRAQFTGSPRSEPEIGPAAEAPVAERGRPSAAAEASVEALIDAVGERAEAMRETLDELSRSLEVLEHRVGLASRQLEGGSERRPPSRRFQRPASSRPRPRPVPATDSARLVAIEMAVAGSTRRAVADRLRTEFGIGRPDPLLDDVFGPGTDGQARMPWGQD